MYIKNNTYIKHYFFITALNYMCLDKLMINNLIKLQTVDFMDDVKNIFNNYSF